MNKLNESYKILGLNNTASIEEVKQAYRKLSKKFHPDMNDGDTFFADKFKELNTAYQYILSNQDSRNQQYNTQEKKKTKEEYRNESAEVPKNKSSNTKENTNPVPIYSFIFLLLAGVAAIAYYSKSSEKEHRVIYVQEEIKSNTERQIEQQYNTTDYNAHRIIPEVRKKEFYYVEIIKSIPHHEFIPGKYHPSSDPMFPGWYEDSRDEYSTREYIETSNILEATNMTTDDEYRAMDKLEDFVRMGFSPLPLLNCDDCESSKIVSRKVHRFDSYREASEHKRNNVTEYE